MCTFVGEEGKGRGGGQMCTFIGEEGGGRGEEAEAVGHHYARKESQTPPEVTQLVSLISMTMVLRKWTHYTLHSGDVFWEELFKASIAVGDTMTRHAPQQCHRWFPEHNQTLQLLRIHTTLDDGCQEEFG